MPREMTWSMRRSACCISSIDSSVFLFARRYNRLQCYVNIVYCAEFEERLVKPLDDLFVALHSICSPNCSHVTHERDQYRQRTQNHCARAPKMHILRHLMIVSTTFGKQPSATLLHSMVDLGRTINCQQSSSSIWMIVFSISLAVITL